MFIMKENPTYHKLISKLWSQPNMDGMLKISFFLDSELLSVVTDQQASVWLMITNNILLNMNQTSDWENWQFYQREILRENLRNSSKEKSRNPEVLKREKSLPPEKYKLKVMSEKPKNNTSRNLSLDFVYLIHDLIF